MGFGRVSNATQLGQPLNFAAAVHLDADESLPRECVFAEVVSGDTRLQPGQVRVTFESGTDSNERSVRITTVTLMDEPVVTVTVTLGCAAKVTRKFVAFIDPPSSNAAVSVTLPPQRVESQVSPIVGLVQGPDVAPPAPARADRSTAPTSKPRALGGAAASDAAVGAGRAAAPKPEAARRASTGTSARTSAARTAPAAATGPRLQLEAVPLIAARAASAPSDAAAIALPDAASAAQAEQLARERQRILVLEEGLAKLRNDSQATQQALAALQARLKEAESERYANPLVYALAWLSALLALAVAGLWWRQSRARSAAHWWASPSAAAAASVRDRATAAGVSELGSLDTPSTGADTFDASTATQHERLPASRPSYLAASPQSAAIVPTPVEPELPRELSVEELIDLEQQVEFFIVLGQDEAAIELLMSHVRSDGGISPMPYLKLLEIYRRRGDAEAYERIRDRFNRRFNAYAPDWASDLTQGRALIDYPETATRLQGLWSAPSRVMETLDASLFRRTPSDATFDLPAYRELLFLYSIARDLAEHGVTPPTAAVDVLLPLAGDVDEVPISRLTATAPAATFAPSDVMTLSLDLDVSAGEADRTDRSGT